MNQAAKHRAKIMLYANGIGPLAQEKNKRRAVAALEQAEKITLRDYRSRQALEELGLKNANVLVTADAAFRFRNADFEGAKVLLDNIQLTGQLAVKQYFCVSIRGWRSLKEDFVTEMAIFCDYMTERYGLVPLFIPMQPSHDAEISTKVLEKLKNRGYYLQEEFTIEEILAIVKGSEFLVGMRLHSIIYGANAATPVIGMVYDPKVAAMLELLGQEYYMNLEDVSAMQLITLAERVMEQRDEIKEQLAAATKALAEKSSQNAVIAYDIINRDLF
jgi:polysaccharide pyruvyl transferase WcaK-like protein